MDYRVIDGSHFIIKVPQLALQLGMVYMSSHSFCHFDRGIITKYIRNPTKPLEPESHRVLSEKQQDPGFQIHYKCFLQENRNRLPNNYQTGPSRGETLTTPSKMFFSSTWRQMRMRWTLRPQRAEINHYTYGSRLTSHLQTKLGNQAFHLYVHVGSSVPSEKFR